MEYSEINWVVVVGIFGILVNILLNVVLTSIILPMHKRLNQMRDNEMHDITERLIRIEDGQKAHMSWHLDNPAVIVKKSRRGA